MSKKNKSARQVSTEGRKENMMRDSMSKMPSAHTHSNMSEGKNQELFIYSLLPKGREYAISTKDLLRESKIQGIRAMQREIEQERRAGAMILSRCDSVGGYYRPADGEQGLEEVAEYLRQMEHRAKAIFYTIKSARRFMREGVQG